LFFRRCLILLILFFSTRLLAEQQSLVFHQPKSTAQSKYVIELLSETYKQLGISFKLIQMNQNDVLAAANEGIIDGQLGKISGLDLQYPNLIKIDVPLLTFNLELISYCQSCSLNQIQSLAIHTDYPVAEKYLASHPYDGQLYKVRSLQTVLNLLIQKQVPAAMVIDFYIEPYEQKLGAVGIQSKTLQEYQIFHYIHRKNEKLVAPLTKILTELKKSGTMQTLQRKHNL